MRSFLFVPADSERKLARGPHSGADALILDLEDSVVPANRPTARTLARGFLDATGSAGFQRWVRVNPLATGAALDDLAAIMPGRPDGILLPKCVPERSAHARPLPVGVRGRGRTAARRNVRVIAIATETPAAMFAMGGYAGVSPRLSGITWGAEDLAACVGGNNRRADGTYDDVYRLARSLCLLGRRRGGGRGDRHDLYRFSRRGRPRARMRRGQALGLYRQDGDPSGADRGHQPRLRRQRGRTRLGAQGRGRCSPQIPTPARSRSTAR